MSEFVLDASVALSWCFEGESNDRAEKILQELTDHQAIVPSLWELEVSNALVVAERRERLTEQDSNRFLRLLQNLPIRNVQWTPSRYLNEILYLAREHTISGYDAAYLWLSREEGLPLATLDSALQNASADCGIAIFPGS